MQEEDEEPWIKESVRSLAASRCFFCEGDGGMPVPVTLPLEARQAYTPTIASVYINKQMIIKNEKYRKMAKII